MLKDVSYFGFNEKCNPEAETCESFKTHSQINHSCCLDETLIFPGIPVVKTGKKQSSLFPPFSIQTFLEESLSDYYHSDFQLKNHQKFDPPEKPIPPNNIRIETQRFLI